MENWIGGGILFTLGLIALIVMLHVAPITNWGPEHDRALRRAVIVAFIVMGATEVVMISLINTTVPSKPNLEVLWTLVLWGPLVGIGIPGLMACLTFKGLAPAPGYMPGRARQS